MAVKYHLPVVTDGIPYVLRLAYKIVIAGIGKQFRYATFPKSMYSQLVRLLAVVIAGRMQGHMCIANIVSQLCRQLQNSPRIAAAKCLTEPLLVLRQVVRQYTVSREMIYHSDRIAGPHIPYPSIQRIAGQIPFIFVVLRQQMSIPQPPKMAHIYQLATAGCPR